MDNQKKNDIAAKVLDELLTLSPDELLKEISKAPDTGFGRFMMESGAHDIMMAEHEKRKT